jgi:hypothetical protein
MMDCMEGEAHCEKSLEIVIADFAYSTDSGVAASDAQDPKLGGAALGALARPDTCKISNTH